DAHHMQEFYTELKRAAPNGQLLAFTAREPLGSSHWSTNFQPSDLPPGRFRSVEYQEVTGGYFDVLGIPIVAGRNFGPQDEKRNVVLVNESLAHLYWPNEIPVGRTVQSRRVTSEIIG